MRTLKIVLMTILFTMLLNSCTDLISNDDQVVMDSIPNTEVITSTNTDTSSDLTGGSSGTDTGDGKGG